MYIRSLAWILIEDYIECTRTHATESQSQTQTDMTRGKSNARKLCLFMLFNV